MDWDLHQQKLWKNKKTGVVAFLVVIQGPKVRTMACIETRECQNVPPHIFEADWERYYPGEEE